MVLRRKANQINVRLFSMSEATPAETTTAPAQPELTSDLQALVDFIDAEVAAINGLPKKSNYHNARRSAYMTIRNLIIPPPPKPAKAPKEKKEPKVKQTKEEKAAAKAAATAEHTTPEVEGETVVTPIEEGA